LIEAIALGRQDRVACVESVKSTEHGLPQSAPSVEFTEGYLSAPLVAGGHRRE